MDNFTILPIIIVIEKKSNLLFNKTIYQGDSANKSIIYLSNNNLENPVKTFESQIGQRIYRKLDIITITAKDLMSFNDPIESQDLSCDRDIINFISGNPANEITDGIIHFYKNQNSSSFSTRMLCMISVPRTISIRDIIDFTAPYRDFIEEMKVVKDTTPHEYIILLNFRTCEDADNFYKNFNNINFSSFESSVCHLAYVSHVECLSSSSTARFPLLDLTELPTCPVCLERLDEPLNGILTIVCNHTFHSTCIQQMNESTCPVCRYPQTPSIMSDKYKCSVCDLREDLWLCLICANIGCGRLELKHAEGHFAETGHTFAMKIGNNQVWDYAADAHVHRLIANSSDGKPVEIDSENPEDKKLSSICMEYTALLADQLASQKMYLESEFCGKLSLLEHELNHTSRIARENEEKFQMVLKEKNLYERRLNQTSSTLQKLQREHEEEVLLNKTLLEKQSHLNKDLKSKDDQLKELQEQLNDLMMNLQMGSRIEEARNRGEIDDEELLGASVSIGQSQIKPRRHKKK